MSNAGDQRRPPQPNTDSEKGDEMKWFENWKKARAAARELEQEKIQLLRSIAGSLRELEGSIDRNPRYGNAIKTTNAMRY